MEVARSTRVRTFIYLVMKGALLTNKERHRRHMTDNSLCQLCGMGEEDIFHVLRRCDQARELWQFLVPSHELRSFFSSPFDKCFAANIKPGINPGAFNHSWSTVFGIACWKLWDTRKIKLFSKEVLTPSLFEPPSLPWLLTPSKR